MNRTSRTTLTLTGQMVGISVFLLARATVEARSSVPPAYLVPVPVRRKTS